MVQQFHIKQEVEYLEWCNANSVCLNDLSVNITTPNLSDYRNKNTKHRPEVMKQTIKHIYLIVHSSESGNKYTQIQIQIYSGIEINHNQEQLEHIL